MSSPNNDVHSQSNALYNDEAMRERKKFFFFAAAAASGPSRKRLWSAGKAIKAGNAIDSGQ